MDDSSARRDPYKTKVESGVLLPRQHNQIHKTNAEYLQQKRDHSFARRMLIDSFVCNIIVSEKSMTSLYGVMLKRGGPVIVVTT